MKIYKLFPNTLEMKRSTHEAACYDIHAHLRPPVPPEDITPIIRSVKWFDCYNQPHETTPETVFVSDIPNVTFTLGPKCRALIPTGMVFDIPVGFSARLHPRSGLAWKNGITLINVRKSLFLSGIQLTFHSRLNMAIVLHKWKSSNINV